MKVLKIEIKHVSTTSSKSDQQLRNINIPYDRSLGPMNNVAAIKWLKDRWSPNFVESE